MHFAPTEPVIPFGFSPRQAVIVQRALEREMMRANSRARDDRLTEEIRAGESELYRNIRPMLDDMHRRLPQ